MNIIKGKTSGAVRAIFYGTEGIGKSTLAANLPDALIVDTEDGTGQIDASRVLALDWRSIEQATKELIDDPQGFRSVIYDSADWMEKALIEHMLKQGGKKSIEDFGYGKGYTMIQENIVRFLAQVDQLIAKGIHVVFVAHSICKRTSPPDQTDGFDRYELKLTKQVSPLLKEWADVILFCNYKIQIVEGTDGRLKAQGGKERIMYATHSAAWDAKNRFGLPDEMPMEYKQIERLFVSAAPRATKQQEAAQAVVAAMTHDPEAELAAATPAPAKAKAQPAAAKATPPQPPAAPAKEAPGAVPFNVIVWLENNEDALNAYFVKCKWLTAGLTWRDLSNEQMHTIVDRADKLARAAGVPAMGAKEAA